MGGTSDSESAAQESAMHAAMRPREARDTPSGSGLTYWNLPTRLRGRVLPPE